MEYLSLDEIIYITRFLNLENTFRFIKSLKYNLNYNLEKSMLIKNKKLMVIENIYESYLKGFTIENKELKELLQFFRNEIDIEDLICFMANIYPNYPKLKDTILFDLLKEWQLTYYDWSVVKTHFKCKKSDFKNLQV